MKTEQKQATPAEIEINAHLCRSHAALKPAIPDPMTAICFPDGDSMAMCLIW